MKVFSKLLYVLTALVIQQYSIAATCTIAGTATAGASTCSTLTNGDTMLVTGTLSINSNYIVHQNTNIVLIVDGGSIIWNGNVDLNLGLGASVVIQNGGALVNGSGSCNANKTLTFGTNTNTSCNGGGAVYSFADFNSAGGGSVTGPLPVTLLNFNAEPTDKGVQLYWSTASEKDNEFFEIERSVDGQNFALQSKVAGQLNATSITSYTFLDTTALEGLVYYYRLKQVDNSGTFSYSNIVRGALLNKQESWDAVIYPNPGSDWINLKILDAQSSIINFTLINSNGEQLWNNSIDIKEGEKTNYRFNIKNQPQGIYFLRVETNGESKAFKLEKE